MNKIYFTCNLCPIEDVEQSIILCNNCCKDLSGEVCEKCALKARKQHYNDYHKPVNLS